MFASLRLAQRLAPNAPCAPSGATSATRSHGDQRARPHGRPHHHPRARARHRREHDDLLGRQLGRAPAAALPAAGPCGPHRHRACRRARAQAVLGLGARARRSPRGPPVVRERRRLDPRQRVIVGRRLAPAARTRQAELPVSPRARGRCSRRRSPGTSARTTASCSPEVVLGYQFLSRAGAATLAGPWLDPPGFTTPCMSPRMSSEPARPTRT